MGKYSKTIKPVEHFLTALAPVVMLSSFFFNVCMHYKLQAVYDRIRRNHVSSFETRVVPFSLVFSPFLHMKQ